MAFLITVALLVVAAILLQLRERKPVAKNLASLLPVYKIENDLLVSKHGDITAVFKVELPELFTLSSEEYEGLHHTWVRAIRLLPAGTILHKQDWFVEAKFQGKFEREEAPTFIQQESERFFHERPVLDHDCYVMITRKANGRKPSSSVFSNLLRSSIVPQDAVTGQALHDFTDKLGQFARLLSDGGWIKVERMTGDQLGGSDTEVGILERYLFLHNKQEKPLIRDIRFKPEFMVGEKYCQMFAMADVEDMPSLAGSRINYDKYSTDKTKFSIGFAAPLGQILSCNHIYNQVIVVEDTQKVLKKLESKRLRLQSLSAYSRENAISREAVNAFLNEAISQGRQPVRAHYNLLVWSEKASDLKELRNKAASALAQMDANPRQEIVGAPQIFWGCMPGNEADLPDNEMLDTFAEQAACFFTMESTYRDSISDFGLRVVDRSGRPIWLDISDIVMRNGTVTNRNKAVFGGSGSGKSLLMAHLHRSYYEQGAHIVIVDVGHSYKGLCDLVNGYYFTYSEQNPIKFNPFFVDSSDIMDTEFKESLKTLILSLWKKDDEPFRRSEYVAISNALHYYYEYLGQHPEVFPCFDTFYEWVKTDYVQILDKQEVKEKEFDVANFLYVLRPFYGDGEFGYLLNATEKLDLLHQRFIVYELDNIKDHAILFSVTTLMIMSNFISKMRKLKGVRKVITIEEAWKAIAKAGMAEFIKYLYKTIRKFYGEAIVVSQEIDDVISSPIIKEAILNNADCKILLDMRKFANRFDQIQTTLGMQDKGKMMVLSLNKANDPARKYREFYVDLSGQVMKVYGYEPSPAEYWAYTTEEKEKLQVQQYAAKFGGDIKQGIRALLADLKENEKK
ncbi:TraG family conjugative transposon ATPase [Pseudoflavitalea sp. X16]|uniref:TraG family conjugative transposon ATPase n=1 Tax=Paraflavitalea devenefica TaxID=2716334 RepID=UPI001422B707|nr:TraG family conjugative transposon ATPase [Paraflavitalea devenefica]NII26155.1 TraG family conjugative transposon ATPase [Paraflavitalea devenefica]